MVGSAITRALRAAGYQNLLTPRRLELDLTNAAATQNWFAQNKPDYVFLAAAKVGGIIANRDYPADFIRDNLAIELNVIDASYRHQAKKILFLGSSCIYPKLAPQPIREEYLLTGALEPTNQPYAIAKIAGLEMIQSYRRQYGFDAIAVMPTNLYGPGDNYHPQNSHVLPALLRKCHEAKIAHTESVEIWGSGTPRREFLHVDDLAAACLHVMNHYQGETFLNVGVGSDVTIAELAQIIAKIVGFSGHIRYDASKPDGTPRKLLDVSRINQLGWSAKISLEDGIRATYQDFLASLN